MTTLEKDSGRKLPARLAGSAILACQSDQRLAELAAAGHERAFDAIVSRYRKPLERRARRILPESRAEDAVQQTFINAHAVLVAGDAPDHLKPWLYAITRNVSLNMLRQNGWDYDEIPLDFDGVRRPDQAFEQTVQLRQTVDAVKELPERQRSALVMRELEGRSYAEIALALGAADGAVRQLLNRARESVRAAAAAIVPPPMVVRAAAHMPPADGRRIAEVAAGFGAAGIAKAGATAVVAGTLVVGAVKAPLPIGHGDRAGREKATLQSERPAARAAAAAAGPGIPDAGGVAGAGRAVGHERASEDHGRGRGRGGEKRDAADDRSRGGGTNSGLGGGAGSDDRLETRHRSGSNSGPSEQEREDHSGSDRTRAESEDRVREEDDHSGPGDGSTETEAGTEIETEEPSAPSPDSGSGSGDALAPDGLSDDLVESGSGTSGSGESGSGESSSGTSGSGTGG